MWIEWYTMVHSLLDSHLLLASLLHIVGFSLVALVVSFGIPVRCLFFCPTIVSCSSSMLCIWPFYHELSNVSVLHIYLYVDDSNLYLYSSSLSRPWLYLGLVHFHIQTSLLNSLLHHMLTQPSIKLANQGIQNLFQTNII